MSDVMTEEQQQLAMDNIGIVHLVASRFRGRVRSESEIEELVGCGYVALCRSAMLHGVEGGAKFSTYAYNACRNEMSNFLTDCGLIHTPRGQAKATDPSKPRAFAASKARLVLGIEELTGYETSQLRPDQLAEQAEQRRLDTELIESYLRCLPPREQDVFRRRLAGEKYREIADTLGCSNERIRQLIRRSEQRIAARYPQTRDFFEQNRKGAA